jgi:hypothetical protein
MDHCISKVYETGSRKRRYSGMCFDGKDYWLAPRHDGPVARWDPETKEATEYDDFPDGFIRGEYSFWSISYAGGFVWLFPNRANMALKINIQDGSLAIAAEFQPECEHEKTDTEFFAQNYIMSRPAGDVIYAHTGKSNRFLEYNLKTMQSQEEYIAMPEEAIKETAAMKFKKSSSECVNVKDCSFYEDALLTLQDFLCYVDVYETLPEPETIAARQIEICRGAVQHADGTAGNAIFEKCKQEIK